MTLLRLEGDLPDGVMFQGWTQALNLSARRSPAFIIPKAMIGASSSGFPSVRSFPTRGFGVSDDVYATVSYPVGQGYTEGGSSGSAIFSSPGTVGRGTERRSHCRVCMPDRPRS